MTALNVGFLRKFTGRLAGVVGELGWRDGLLRVIARGLGILSAGRCRIIKYYIVCQPVPPIAPDPGGMKHGKGLQIARVWPGDALVSEFPRPRAVIERRYESGAMCFVATLNGTFVGFLWIQEGPYEEDEVHCLFVPQPPDAVAWDFDVYVEPRFRLGRAFNELWNAAHRYLAGKGVRWTVSRISAFNPDSLRVHRRLNAQKVGWAVFVLVGPLQFTILSTRPFVRLSAGARSRPVMRVGPAGKWRADT